ncbi:NAD(+)/NADH kinase [Lachnospiraceae bacterium ZAX-1]
MNKFYIIANEQKDKKLKLTKQLQAFLLSHGKACSYGVNRESNLNNIPKDTECILVLGGDGTLIRAARDMVGKNIPLIGVNMGHVGYLCELESSTVETALEHLWEDNYMIENRMMLNGYCIQNEGRSKDHLALNDIVIYRSGLLQIVNLIIYVNGEYLNTYSADGIIIATPTGSTAYNMSAGGPIVDPKANLILITPISPHSFNAKSIVLSAEDEIIVEIGSRRMEQGPQNEQKPMELRFAEQKSTEEFAEEEFAEQKFTTEVSFDGNQPERLAVGDKIVIKRAKANTQILKLSKLSFLDILRKKMQGYT